MKDLLLARAQRGDQHAFQQVVELYTSLVWRTSCALVGDRRLAREAQQQSWLEVWKTLDSYQGCLFRPWLLTIVASCSRRIMYTTPARKITSCLEETIYLPTDEENATQAFHLEYCTRLKQAFLQLSPDQRCLLELRFFAELELAEIALVTNVPMKVTKADVERALEKLHATMERIKQSENAISRIS